jgi:hypothetical protein
VRLAQETQRILGIEVDAFLGDDRPRQERAFRSAQKPVDLLADS